MRVEWKELSFATHVKQGAIDITGIVEKTIAEMGCKNGIVLLFLPHATASLVLNEAEDGVLTDVLAALEKVAPVHGKYEHNRIDDNGHAHVRASILYPFVVLPVRDGRIVRGMWQNVILVEHDGPRKERKILFVYVGD